MAEMLAEIIPDCLRRMQKWSPGGDIAIGQCADELGIPLTHHRGMHQIDMFGCAAGIMESAITEQIAFHHLGNVVQS